jgi:hypothetical protein
MTTQGDVTKPNLGPAGTTFYLGCPEPSWLARVDVPLFVSHRRLSRRPGQRLPQALGSWALDSGGFSEIDQHGRWLTTPEAYAAAVRRYRDEIGGLAWAAPQDWMCEPRMLAKTGLTVAEHQARTVENFLHLRELAPDLPIIPVLQGWILSDYLACVDQYDRAGVDLLAAPVVGVGSVCRRQATGEIGEITGTLAALGLNLHGFGVKTQGLARYAENLVSADSMAWSKAARMEPRRPGCEHRGNCASCLPYALDWRSSKIVGSPAPPVVHPAPRVTKLRPPPAGAAPVPCASCGSFTSTSATGRPARYCSPKCRQKAYRVRAA